MILTAFDVTLVSFSVGPCFAFVALLYTETSRLQLVIEDFLVELNTFPFSFKVHLVDGFLHRM